VLLTFFVLQNVSVLANQQQTRVTVAFSASTAAKVLHHHHHHHHHDHLGF